MRRARRGTWLGVALTLVSCDEARPNLTPVARAELRDHEPVGQGAYVVDYGGEPVELVLDGSASDDPDGRITEYLWMSGTRDPSGAPGRYVQAGEGRDWPEDGRTTQVVLPEGFWTFHLYVRDDGGAVSDPATLRITVGDPPPIPDRPDGGTDDDGGAAVGDADACTETIDGYAAVSEACSACICNGPGACADLAVSECDESCWDLVACTLGCVGRDPISCVPSECAAHLGQLTNALAIVDCTLPCEVACALP